MCTCAGEAPELPVVQFRMLRLLTSYRAGNCVGAAGRLGFWGKVLWSRGCDVANLEFVSLLLQYGLNHPDVHTSKFLKGIACG